MRVAHRCFLPWAGVPSGNRLILLVPTAYHLVPIHARGTYVQTDTSLVRKYLEAASRREANQESIGELVGASQSAVSDWLRKLADKESITLRSASVREAMQNYLLRPERPEFSEGVAYAVGSMRAMLEDLEQRMALSLETTSMDAAVAEAHADEVRRQRGSPPEKGPRSAGRPKGAKARGRGE